MQADALEVTATLASGHFVRGVDATNDQPVVSLRADYSFNSGYFVAAECYRSTNREKASLPQACQLNAGYFKLLEDNQAVEFSIAYNDYREIAASQWDYAELTGSWHLNRNLTFSLSASDDWFGRGFASMAGDVAYRYHINHKLSARMRAGLLVLENRAPENYFEHIELGLHYAKARWGIGVSAMLVDSDIRRMTHFDLDQPELNINISYQLY